jgi:tRNA(fMet)-specific endonuclease VapC
MSFEFMLDTNVISDLIRNPTGRVATRLEETGETNVCCSIIVAAELRFGVAKVGSEKLAKRVEVALSAIPVIPFDMPADREYAKLRAHLNKRGKPIGPNDMLIAAHALAQEATLVTDNLREFKRVSGLSVINWRAR